MAEEGFLSRRRRLKRERGVLQRAGVERLMDDVLKYQGLALDRGFQVIERQKQLIEANQIMTVPDDGKMR